MLIGIAVLAEWVAAGGNFLAFKVVLESFPPVLMMSVRLLIAGTIMLVLARIVESPMVPSAGEARSILVSGVLLLVIGQGGIVWGVQHLPAGTTAMFGSSAPLFVAILSWLWLRQRLRLRQYVGIVLGFVGLAMVTLSDGGTRQISLFGVSVTLVGSVSWALGSLYERRAHGTEGTLVVVASQMLAAGLLLFAIALVVGDVGAFEWRQVSARAVVALAYLAMVGLVIGFGAFVWLSRTTSATVAKIHFSTCPR